MKVNERSGTHKVSINHRSLFYHGKTLKIQLSKGYLISVYRACVCLPLHIPKDYGPVMRISVKIPVFAK